jgi:hypothetical protein
MRSMVEGACRWASPVWKPPSVRASRYHLPIPGRIELYGVGGVLLSTCAVVTFAGGPLAI